MKEEEINIKTREYSERNQFWTDKAITQLGFSIHLFTTLGIGFLAFLNKTNDLQSPTSVAINYYGSKHCEYNLIPSIFITISIFLGFISVLSRLFDFRITRHLSYIRKKYFSINKNKLGLLNTESESPKYANYIFVFIKTLICKIDLIKIKDYKDNHDRENLKNRFQNLKNQSDILGEITWKSHIIQIIFFIFSIFLYIIRYF